MIDIKGLDKWKVLQALYNAARSSTKKVTLSLIEADALIAHRGEEKLVFVRINDRWLYLDLTGDKLVTKDFDKVNGRGAAASAIEAIRKAKRSL